MWVRQSVDGLHRVSEKEESRIGMHRMDRNERTSIHDEHLLSQIRDKVTSELLTNYPDISNLYGAMADFLGVNESNIFFHTGSDLVIKSIFETFINAEDKILLHKPSYAMYSVYAELYQADVIYQSFSNSLEFDLVQYINMINIHKPKLVVFENPNGFIGTGFHHDKVEELIKTANQNESLIIIDEAYIDFTNQSVVDLIHKYDNLIIVRTLSKAWGIAGLRVGYVISNEKLISYIEKVRPMHELTGFSVCVAETLLENQETISNYVNEMELVRNYFKKEMKKRNIDVADSQANFVTVRLGAKLEVERFREFIHQRKFLIRRPFREKELVEWVRIGLLPMQEMEQFIELLDLYLSNNQGVEEQK